MASQAKAAGVMVNLETGECKLIDLIADSGEGLDPRFRCEALWDSVKCDWPGWEAAFVSNEAADKLAEHRKLWQVGLCEDDAMSRRLNQHQAEVEARNAQ
jgi:hypothetical protein